VEAAFLGFNNGKLQLHKVNGVIVEVPSERCRLTTCGMSSNSWKRRQRPQLLTTAFLMMIFQEC
jgi:hypothetical protein